MKTELEYQQNHLVQARNYIGFLMIFWEETGSRRGVQAIRKWVSECAEASDLAR